MSQKQPYESYEDRRRFPRIGIGVPAELTFQGKSLRGKIHDLSPDGLQVRCNRKTLQAIRPSGKYIHREDAPVLETVFKLDVRGKVTEIHATVRMYYFVLLPGERDFDVAFGGQFMEFGDHGEQIVERFISDAITPLETEVLALLDRPQSSDQLTQSTGADSNTVNGLLARLVKQGEVIPVEEGGHRRHVKLKSAIAFLIERTDLLETRIARLEADRKQEVKN